MKLLKIALWPLGLLYGLVMWVRNLCFDKGWIGSVAYPFPVIAVGNLTAGGTGKTPHVEYLLRHMDRKADIGVVSRGYGRQSKGVIVAGAGASAALIGDEPFQYFNKFPGVKIAVGSRRTEAIAALLKAHPGTDRIILDDAFQHRYVRAGLYILLTDYSRLYTDDMVLPAGYLREFTSGARRAQIIIVTKCPENLSQADIQRVLSKLKPAADQEAYFTAYRYGELVAATNLADTPSADTEIVLVTGIARAKPLYLYLGKKFSKVHWLEYGDHHRFTPADMHRIRETWQKLPAVNKAIITTEKDMMRLQDIHLKPLWQDMPVFYQPLEVSFLAGEQQFLEHIRKFTG